MSWKVNELRVRRATKGVFEHHRRVHAYAMGQRQAKAADDRARLQRLARQLRERIDGRAER